MKEVTPDWLCLELAAVKAQIAVQTERSKGDTVSLGQCSFACELDWASWCMGKNTSGNGWTTMVDFNRIWAFGSLDQVATPDWLRHCIAPRQQGI